ncbi:MAG: hypothetical protein SPL00_04990 [Bacilli bacterium]|nr:hypothetical protein [Bacilli bacterium]
MKKNEPEIDESLLTEEQKEELHKKRFPLAYIIFVSALVVAAAVCLILIKVL